MKAVRWYGRGDVRVLDVDPPGPPPPGWVTLRMTACGICGTDVEEYTDGPVVVPVQPHPLTGTCAPLTLGHETVGVVEAVGEGVTLRPGTAVAVDGNISCGECEHCRRGTATLCPKLGSLGQHFDGGLAEFLLAPEFTCFPYSDGIPADVAVFAEPLSVAVRAVARAGIGVGTDVGIVGAGTIGQLCLQVARRAGARTVTVIEPHPGRRDLALRLGADIAVAPGEPVGGPAVVIDASGRAASAAAAVRWTATGGRTVLLSVFPGDLAIDMADFLLREKQVIASLSHSNTDDFPIAVSLLERGEIDVRPLVTDRLPLERIVTDGFKALRDHPGDHLKILAMP
ncbi:MAG TPA: alcohol dehydrogenase catalytic domain-containing protein [Mycobacteriales bacterium]|nr:alcohol dehydrogenase catalytic domain-containing protein [Mycobacteriales bacterium]